MAVFYQICEWGLVLALVAFVLVLIYLAVTALSIKNTAMRCAKRLYERPVNSAKSIGTTGKGIVLQQKVRALRIADTAKGMAGDVKDVATDVKAVGQSIHPEELKAAFGNVKATLGFLAAVRQFAEALTSQKAAHDRT